MWNTRGQEKQQRVDLQLAFGLWIRDKFLEAIDEVGAIERIASNPHASGLTQTNLRCLVYSFVRQSPTATHDT